MVGSRELLESTMCLDEIVETCTTPAGIETITYAHLPSLAMVLFLPIVACCANAQQAITKTTVLTPPACCRPATHVSPDPLSPQISAAIAPQSLDVAVDNSFLPAIPDGSQLAFPLSASTQLERDTAAAGCRAGDMNHDTTLRWPLFR